MLEKLSNKVHNLADKAKSVVSDNNLILVDSRTTNVFGGDGGKEFDDNPDKRGVVQQRIASVSVSSDRILDRIIIHYEYVTKDKEESQNVTPRAATNDTEQLKTIEKQMCKHGGEGGDLYSLQLQPNEYITKIIVRTGRIVESLTFTTNLGNMLGPCGTGRDTSSKNVPSKTYRIQATSSFMLTSVYGRSGKYLDGIGFRFSKIISRDTKNIHSEEAEDPQHDKKLSNTVWASNETIETATTDDVMLSNDDNANEEEGNSAAVVITRLKNNYASTSYNPTLLSFDTSFRFHVEDFINRQSGVDFVNDNYEVGGRLGSGGFGVVYNCIHKATGQNRAMKIISKKGMNKKNRQQVENEFEILKDLDHPNILKLYDFYENDDYYYFFTDICKGGELFDEIIKRGHLNEFDAAQIMNQLLSCIHYCHSLNIVHRDLKPENILLEEDKDFNDITIIDFGLALICDKTMRCKERMGSVYYMAPEVFTANSICPKGDIWSCGVIGYFLLSGTPPFRGETPRQKTKEIIDKIIVGELQFDSPIWENITETAKNFIMRLLAYEPNNRPTAEEALKHPWLVQSQRESIKTFQQQSRSDAVSALNNLKGFAASTKLKQAVCVFIASQLVFKEEREKIDEVFRALDIKRDGKLSKDEVKEGFATYFGRHISNDELDEMFSRVDSNNSECIEYSEFVFASMDKSLILSNEKLKNAFDFFDINQKGSISPKDLKELLSSLHIFDEEEDVEGDQKSQKLIDDIIQQVDEDGDGTISFEEFKMMMLKKL